VDRLNYDIVVALIKAMGMFSENMQRQQTGQSMAYGDSAFFALVGELPSISPETPDARG
jgi:hypothetical protein